jgi:Zn-dependent peptidase ImmA (M78 family)
LDISIKWMEPDDIKEKVSELFISGNYNIPIDIENIVEVKNRILIYPIENLPQKAYLTKDLKNIYVNLNLYNDPRYANMYRFILAHEFGHFTLHKYVYDQANYNSIDDYKIFINNFNEKQYKYFEWQANQFAGNLLVPDKKITEEYYKYYSIVENVKKKNEDALMSYFDMKSELGKIFCVSDDCIERRLIDLELE